MSPGTRAHDPAVNGDESLGRIVERLTRRLQEGEQLDPSELAREYPEHAGQLAEVWPALQALADLGRAASEVPGDGPRDQAEEGLGQLGDFRLIREVGRGGMGVVYEAEQVSLGRRVALKVLPFAATMDPRQLQRFHNEARAAASLDHPHIVHVHAVGCERAVHFYAMQFIEGQTLAAMIADLGRRGGQAALPEAQPTTPHVPGAPAAAAPATAERAAASTEPAPRDRAYFRRAADLGAQAAAALEHAHQLGIVHRDVKPANLLVDGHGHLWVTDFGLAHVQSDARLTMTGDLVGTLRYMSPEQALAKRVVLDHRTDVYSLGATLYELLTLEPVFAGSDREELLRQIAFEEPRPPTRHDRAIPAELETIVLKAIAKNPTDRYATAQELADDLTRFLQDKPIRAKRATLVMRARKLARRHWGVAGTLAGSAVVMLVLAVVLLSANYLRLSQEQKRTKAEFDRAEGETIVAAREREEAEDRLRLVFEALDEVYVKESDKRSVLHKQEIDGRAPLGPQGEQAEREFLEKGLRFYQRLSRRPGTSPAARAEVGKALWRVGVIQQGLRHYGEAEDAFREALGLLEDFVKQSGSLPEEASYRGNEGASYRWNLGRCHLSLAFCLAESGRREKAVAEFEEAVAAYEGLVAADDGNLWWRHELAYACVMCGDNLHQLGRLPEAEAALSRGVAVHEKLVADAGTAGNRARLAWNQKHLGYVRKARGQRALAAESWRAAASRLEEAGVNDPQLASVYEALADLYREDGRLADAVAARRQAVAAWGRLAAATNEPDHRWHLAGAGDALGELLHKTSDVRGAKSAYRGAVSVWEQLVRERPGSADCRAHLYWSYRAVINLLLPQGRHAEAAELALKLPQTAPTIVGSYDAAATYLARCLPLADKDEKLSPAERGQAARDYADRAREFFRQAVPRCPDHPGEQNNLAWRLVGGPDPRLYDAKAAVELAKKAVAGAARTPGHEPEYWNTLGAASYRAGDWQGAIDALKKSHDLFRGQHLSANGFFLAMAQWKKGDPGAARRWYAASVAWMGRNAPQNEELLRFRAEAAAVLGLPAQAPPEKSAARDELEIVDLILTADPDAGWAWRARGRLYEQRGRLQEARANYRRAVELYTQAVAANAGDASRWSDRGLVYAELGQWGEAAADFAKAVERAPDLVVAWYWHALTRLAAGDTAGYRNACAGMVGRFGPGDKAESADWVPWTCLLAPEGVKELDRLVETTERLHRNNPQSDHYLRTFGVALYRAGRYEEAVQRLNEEIALGDRAGTKPPPYSRAYTWFFLAVAHHRLGHAGQAREWLDKAVKQADQEARITPGAADIAWNRHLTLRLFRAEAERLIEGGGSNGPAPKEK